MTILNGTVRAIRLAKRGLDLLLGAVMLVTLTGIIALVLVQIIQRYVPFVVVQWTEEMSRYLFVYLTFIGSALLIKEKGHIVVDVAVEQLPRRLQLVVYVLVQVAVLAFLYIFVSGVLILASTTMETRSSSMPWFTMGYLYWGVWAGGILMFLYTCIEIGKGVVRLIRRGSEETSPEEPVAGQSEGLT